MKKLLLSLALMVAIAAMGQSVRIENQKMVLTSADGIETILTPNGDDASYFWASLSPNGQHLVYTTAHLGTYVCDINGQNVQCMGRMNAPKWADDAHVFGMQEFYNDNDEIDHIRYISRDITGRITRELNTVERDHFIQAEELRLAREKARQDARIRARKAVHQAGLSGIKIYINPGHGGYNANDRSCWTIPVPATWTDSTGYWESKSNLMKGLILKELLEGAGATVYISRTTNKSGARDIEYYPGATPEQLLELQNGDDRDLSAIAEEANANNVDHFISVHSNALNSQTNYLLMLWHGTTAAPTVANSDSMAISSGTIQFQNELTVWTTSAPLFRGDLTFYNDDMGLGVLRPLTVPGFLSEGSFHDYPPETHRLMNYDYCKLEATRMYQHFHRYFKRDLPQTGIISGWVKSSNELVDVLNQPKFLYIKNSDDQWLPINGAMVELLQDGNPIDTATTDNWYNGVFAFYNLTPGTYVLRVSANNYKSMTDTVVVAAEQIACEKIRLKNIHLNPADYPEPETSASALDNYEFKLIKDSAMAKPNFKRIKYRNGYIYALDGNVIYRYDLNMENPVALDMPASVEFSDIAFASDDYLFAKVKDAETLYMWDDECKNPEISTYTAPVATENNIAVKGPHWNPTIFSANEYVVVSFAGTALIENGALFRYAGHAYDAHLSNTSGNLQWQLLDMTTAPNFTLASDLYPATPVQADAWANIAAWTEGKTLHVIFMTDQHFYHYASYNPPTLNIYASEIKYENDQFSFRLNENATAVKIAIETDGTETASHDCGALNKGVHTIANPFGGMGWDAFSITASARPVADVTKVSDDSEIFQFYAPRGLCVDKNPQSPNFGRIYAAEAVGGPCSEVWYDTPETFRTVTQGIYIIGADFTDVTGQGATAYNGGVEWGTNAGGSYQFALTRPCAAPDGDVFVGSSTLEASGAYIMDGQNPSAPFQPVFDGKRSASNGQLKSGKNVVCNQVMNSYIEGTGKDEILYTYDRDISAGVSGCIWQYNIGEVDSLPWKAKPTKVFFENATQDNHMQNANGQIASDHRGGFFLSQYRYNSSWAVPALLHCNAQGVKDFNISNNGIDAAQQGGMNTSVDGNMIGMGAELGTIRIWDVAYDDAGAPTLTSKYEIVWAEGGRGNTYGVDFDYAGNVYIISNSNERLMVYALPKVDNTCTVRVINEHKGTGFEEMHNAECKMQNVQKMIRHGQLYILRDGKLYNAQGIVMQ